MRERFLKNHFFKIIICLLYSIAQTKNQQNFLLKKMDSSVTTSISTTVNQLYFKGPARRQNWSLPDSIIYYISKHPKSPKCYQKMIQCCKYFFFKNPIIVCSELRFYGREHTSKIVIRKDGEKKYIDLKNVSQCFWITDKIFIDAKENVISSLIPKIYQCDVKELTLGNQTISFNELLFLASKANRISLCCFTINNEDGSVVSVEKIIEAFVQVETFICVFNENDPSISSKTVENLLKIPHFSSIERIDLNEIPEVFDIETFFAYMKKNKHTFFELAFGDSISELYENRLIEIVDEILATENRDYKPPMFYFDGLSFEHRCKLRRIAY